MAEKIRIVSDIQKNAYIAGSNITINGKIDGDVLISAEKIRIGKEANITGTLKYPEKAEISISESAHIGKKKTYKSNEEWSKTSIIKNTIIEGVHSYLSILLIALISLAIGKRYYQGMQEMIEKQQDGGSIIKTLGIGLCILIAVPVLSIMVLLTVVGIPLTIIALLLYGILIYTSAIPTAYYLGNLYLGEK